MCRLHTNPEPQFEAPQHNHGSKQSADLKTWLAQHGEFRPLAEQFHRLHHR